MDLYEIMENALLKVIRVLVNQKVAQHIYNRTPAGKARFKRYALSFKGQLRDQRKILKRKLVMNSLGGPQRNESI